MEPDFKQVVVVDDDASMLRLLTQRLRMAGYEPRVADNGSEALELIQEKAPAYLITDLDMPELDGFELCRRLRSLALPRYVYAVVLTSHSGENDLVKAMEAGADDFLGKPLRARELLARLAAGARVLQLESRLSRLADQDALTGAMTRRAFNSAIEKEWERAIRYGSTLSAVMVDIDYFKRINDTYGHPAGDEVIRHVAAMLLSQVRGSDVVCRFGGEEFCVLLTETSEADAAGWAERVRKKLAESKLDARGDLLQLTASFGVAGILGDMEHPSELLEAADQLLLAAKERGRNQVRTLSQLSHEHGPIDPSEDHALFQARAAAAMMPLLHSVRPDWSLARVAAYLTTYRVSTAPVTNEEGDLLGVVSEKDVLAVAQGARAKDRTAGEIMRENVVSYDESAPLAQVLSCFARAPMRNVFVTSNGRPVGLINRGTLLRWVLEDVWGERRFAVEYAATGEEASSPLRGIAEELIERSHELRHWLVDTALTDDVAPLVGGVSRMQRLLDELLAGAAGAAIRDGGLHV